MSELQASLLNFKAKVSNLITLAVTHSQLHSDFLRLLPQHLAKVKDSQALFLDRPLKELLRKESELEIPLDLVKGYLGVLQRTHQFKVVKQLESTFVLMLKRVQIDSIIQQNIVAALGRYKRERKCQLKARTILTLLRRVPQLKEVLLRGLREGEVREGKRKQVQRLLQGQEEQ